MSIKVNVLLLMVFLTGCFTAQAQATKPRIIPGQFIVELKTPPIIVATRGFDDRMASVNQNKAAREKLAALNAEILMRAKVPRGAVVFQYQDAMVGFTAKLSPEQVEMIRRDPNVMGVYPDYAINLGPIQLDKAPNLINTQAVSCAVEQSGGPGNGQGKPTWIWILDTGIDLDHPDLNVQTRPVFAQSFIPGETVEDGHGHGTHVAGIAAAKNNRYGVVGMSAGATVVPVKVLANNRNGSLSSLLAGLNHVAMYDIRGDVVNMSLGGYGYADCENFSPALRNAIRNLSDSEVWVVMAAGNDGADANQNLPGCINGKRVYTVGAVNCERACARYSNWGSAVDWVAVGTGVYSTARGGGYQTMSGTSMATPVVAGIIHARGGAPNRGGNVNCNGSAYPFARR